MPRAAILLIHVAKDGMNDSSGLPFVWAREMASTKSFLCWVRTVRKRSVLMEPFFSIIVDARPTCDENLSQNLQSGLFVCRTAKTWAGTHSVRWQAMGADMTTPGSTPLEWIAAFLHT